MLQHLSFEFPRDEHGPLVYSLAIKADWKVIVEGDYTTAKFPSWEATPASDWNHGLALDPNQPARGIEFTQRQDKADEELSPWVNPPNQAYCSGPKDRMGVASQPRERGSEIHAALTGSERKQGEPPNGAPDADSLWIDGVTRDDFSSGEVLDGPESIVFENSHVAEPDLD